MSLRSGYPFILAGPLCCSHLSALGNSAAVSICVRVPLSLWFQRTGTELLDHMVILYLIFSGARSTVFHRSCAVSCSHQQCASVPLSLPPYQHLFFIVFNNSHPKGVKGYCILILIVISLMISDAEYLFIYWLAICISSLEKCPLKPFAHFFKLGCLFCCWVLRVFYIE